MYTALSQWTELGVVNPRLSELLFAQPVEGERSTRDSFRQEYNPNLCGKWLIAQYSTFNHKWTVIFPSFTQEV